VPHCGVTTTDTVVVAPSDSDTSLEAEPEVVATPLTVTEASLCVNVGVIVTDDTEFATLPLYDVVDALKVGLSEPALGTSPLKSASVLHARSTIST